MAICRGRGSKELGNVDGSGISSVGEGPTPTGKRTVDIQHKTCYSIYNHLLKFPPASATLASFPLRHYSTVITESSICYTLPMVKAYLFSQSCKTALDVLCEPDGQWRCNSMRAMAIVIHHHNIGLNRSESSASFSVTRI